MFDTLVRELATRFGLVDRAQDLVKTTLAYATKPEHGGLAGFIGKFDAAGLGGVARSWLGGSAAVQAISPAQLETVLGHNGGLISQLVASTSVARQSITPALAYLIPAAVGMLTPDGQIPSTLPPAALAFLGSGSAAEAAAISSTATAVGEQGLGATLMGWMPWLLAALLGLVVLGWCGKRGNPVPIATNASNAANDATWRLATAGAGGLSGANGASSAAAQTPASAASAASGAASAASAADAASAGVAAGSAGNAEGGATVAAVDLGGKPGLKVYFASSQADIAPEFASAAASVLQQLKDHPEIKVELMGFNDPSGNAASNALLAKKRAEAVRAALVKLGVAESRITLLKPSDSTGGAANKAEARRVEVSLH